MSKLETRVDQLDPSFRIGPKGELNGMTEPPAQLLRGSWHPGISGDLGKPRSGPPVSPGDRAVGLGKCFEFTRIRILPVKPIRSPDQGFDRRSPSIIWAGPPPVIRLTGRCRTKPSALDGRCTQMVTLQIAEPFCPRDRLVGGVLHPFGHGNAAESADPTEQIPQKNAPFVAICQVSHKRTVDLDGVDRQSLEVPP